MSDLTVWLRAQIQYERDSINLISAGGCEPDIWTTEARTPGDSYGTYFCPVALVQGGRNEHLHVATDDPQRMLREADAKLAILDHNGEIHRILDEEVRDNARPSYVLAAGASDRVVMMMAAVYSDRDGYRTEWKL